MCGWWYYAFLTYWQKNKNGRRSEFKKWTKVKLWCALPIQNTADYNDLRSDQWYCSLWRIIIQMSFWLHIHIQWQCKRMKTQEVYEVLIYFKCHKWAVKYKSDITVPWHHSSNLHYHNVVKNQQTTSSVDGLVWTSDSSHNTQTYRRSLNSTDHHWDVNTF